MSKAKQNTFLIGFFSVLAVGAAGLGYLAWSSAAASEEAQETYDSTKTKLQSLQKAAIFPKSENVEAKKKQVDAFVDKVRELNAKVQAYQTPLGTEMNSTLFQTKLQKARDGIVAEAKDAGIKLPDNFDLGMGTYLATYPEPVAVPRLDAWMDGIRFFLSTLISKGVKEVNVVSRPELAFEKKQEAKPEEGSKAKVKPAPAAKSGSKAKVEAAPVAAIGESAVLERYPFTVTFTTSSRALNEVMTVLANSAPYFFNIRSLRIENEQKTGADTSAQFATQEENDPINQKPFKRDSVFIFGREKVMVHLGLELIRFPEPAANEATK